MRQSICETIQHRWINGRVVKPNHTNDSTHTQSLPEKTHILYPPPIQKKHPQWEWQWQRFEDDSEWLFQDWISPNTLEDMRGKDVLDCGCGGGQHMAFTAPYAAHVTGIDFNALSVAKSKNGHLSNVSFIEADLAEMNLGKQFDVVYCIGVLHHTDDPERTFRTITKHCKKGGHVIVWVYSHEGNFWNRTLLEWIKSSVLLRLPRSVSVTFGHLLTALLYVPVYTVYLLPIRRLPYHQYFGNWRKLSYRRNLLNVFDKLNAPQTHFLKRTDVERWFDAGTFENVHISPYMGVSWRGSGTKR